MAKDGTMRGGRRAGSGAKKKALADRIAEGNTGHRNIKVLTPPEPGELPPGRDMPKPKAFLGRKQANGKSFMAKKIYAATWRWLNEKGVDQLVNPDSIERYAMSAARWIQCEDKSPHAGDWVETQCHPH